MEGLSREELEAAQELLKYNKAINHSVTEYIKFKDKIAKKEREIIRMREAIATLERESVDGNEEQLKTLRERLETMESSYRIERAALGGVSKQKMLINKIDKATQVAYAGYIGLITSYLLNAQKSYKTINRELSLSNQRSAIMLNNMISVADSAHKIGLTFDDIAKIQSAYSNELGRSVLLSENNLRHITYIAKGLGLSVEESGKLVGLMDNFGLSVESSAGFYEKTLKSSRAMGLNASKVIKTINDNLSKSQQYVFKGGVAGLAKMAQYSVKFKTSMESVFNAIDKANSIEGAVDMVSNLQVLGGKFASLDFHTTLYQARNDASAFTKTMGELTKGMAVYNNTSGEFEIQAGDLQRLKLAAEATGLSYEDMIKNAKEMAKTERLDQMLFGRGLNRDQKDFISSVASIGKDGKFTVDIGDGIMRDVRSLTSGQINALQKSSDGLKQAAENAVTFDESWKNLINQTKSLFLPLLKYLNKGVEILNNDFIRGILKFGVILGGAVVAIKGLFGTMTKLMQFMSMSNNGKGMLGEFITSVKDLFKKRVPLGGGGGLNPSGGSISPNTPDIIDRTGKASSGAWKNTLAFGAAMLMVGTAIKIASDGISKVIEQFQFLSGDQAKEANKMMITFGTTLAVLGAGIVAVGFMGSGAAIGMLAFGASVTLIGAGIALASLGLSKLVSSFGEFGETINKNITGTLVDNVFNLSKGIGALGLASMALGNPLSLIGLYSLNNVISDINESIDASRFNSLLSAGEGMKLFSDSINNINDKKLDRLIELSKGMSDMGNLADAIFNLKDVLSKSIEVKFSDQNVNLNIDITNELGGQFINKISRLIPIKIEETRKGS